MTESKMELENYFYPHFPCIFPTGLIRELISRVVSSVAALAGAPLSRARGWAGRPLLVAPSTPILRPGAGPHGGLQREGQLWGPEAAWFTNTPVAVPPPLGSHNPQA